MPGFLSSLADKAQSAINATPLASHLHRPNSPDSAAQPSANDAAAQGGQKSHALGAIHNQLRAFGQQYTSATPVQKIITIEKSVALHFDSLSRDSKSQSKELYTWGQTESEDLKDVTDRLAYLNFVQGSLSGSLATKLDGARVPLKVLRDAETALAPRRNLRAGLHSQLARLEHDQQKGTEKKIAELKEQIKKAESDDQAQEKEIELLKRKAIRESEKLKWEALREYGEKLVLLSQASTPIIGVLPTTPPTPNQPYTGAQATGAARASLQRALDNYKTGHINLPPQPTGADLHRSDTRSFGESHASELSSIDTGLTGTSGITHTTSSDHKTQSGTPVPHLSMDSHSSIAEKTSSPPINPATLNTSPAPISASPPSAHATPPVSSSFSPSPTPVVPTIAETGMPVTAGNAGPGPASGSLHDIRNSSTTTGSRTDSHAANEAHIPPYDNHPAVASSIGTSVGGDRFESAEEEKRKLQASYSQAHPTTSAAVESTTLPKHESAEEEKKRLEREERERLLRGSDSNHPAKKDDPDDLPPTYQDI